MDNERMLNYRSRLQKLQGDNVGMAREFFKFKKSFPVIRTEDEHWIKQGIKLFFTYGGVINDETQVYFTDLKDSELH